jgi:hypothetical protein
MIITAIAPTIAGMTVAANDNRAAIISGITTVIIARIPIGRRRRVIPAGGVAISPAIITRRGHVAPG